MSALPVVVNLNVLKYCLPHAFTRPESFAVDRFHLQRMEEAFGTRIVITVAPGAHATPQLVPGDQRLIGAGALLAAAITMDDDAAWPLTLPQGHLQRITDQVSRHALRHRPADHPAGIQVNHDGQVQPAFVRPQVGHVTGPGLIRGGHPKVLLEQVGRYRQGVAAVGGRLELPGGPGPQPLTPQAVRHGLEVAGQAFLLHFTG